MNALWKLNCTDGYTALIVATTEDAARSFGDGSRALRGTVTTVVDVTDVHADTVGLDEVLDSDTAALVARWHPSMAPPELRLAEARQRPERAEPIPVT